MVVSTTDIKCTISGKEGIFTMDIIWYQQFTLWEMNLYCLQWILHQLAINITAIGPWEKLKGIVVLTLYQPRTHICDISSHKPIRIYMGGLILGVNTLYRLFCFFKLFPMVGKGLTQLRQNYLYRQWSMVGGPNVPHRGEEKGVGAWWSVIWNNIIMLYIKWTSRSRCLQFVSGGFPACISPQEH